MAFQPFRLGRYHVVELLGQGGMAQVYRLVASGPKGFQKEFAAKRIPTDRFNSPTALRLFETEAKVSASMDHPNIVHVYDFFFEQGSYWLVMEFIRGKNLASLLERYSEIGKVLPVEVTAFLIAEVCKGLDYAFHKEDLHSGKAMEIIHRDISPQNIMLSYEGAVRIVDFGIAKMLGQSSVTDAGVVRGKLGYMSPEQALGLKVDHRTDIFSTGLLLRECLSGEKTFVAESPHELLAMVQRCEIPDPTTVRPDLPPQLERALLRGLARLPQQRYSEVSELQAELEDYLTSLSKRVSRSELALVLREAFPEEASATSRKIEIPTELTTESRETSLGGRSASVWRSTVLGRGLWALFLIGLGAISLRYRSVWLPTLDQVIGRKSERQVAEGQAGEEREAEASNAPPAGHSSTRDGSDASVRVRNLALTSPSDGQDFFAGPDGVRFGFAWEGKEIPRGAPSTYLLEVSPERTFRSAVDSSTTREPNLKDHPMRLRPGIYFWRVTLRGAGGRVLAQSAPRRFQYFVKPLPLPPVSNVRIAPSAGNTEGSASTVSGQRATGQ